MGYVINIGRQLGSGGRAVGQLLAEDLNFKYFDKELVQLASQESGLGKEFFERADEKARFNFLGNFWAGFSSLVTDNPSGSNLLQNDSLFQIQSDVIRQQAEQHSCIFIGRCADYVLRDNPLCLNIFLTANMSDRIQRVAEGEQISAEKAREFIEQMDKKRAAYYNYYSNKVWGAAASYHLCLNSSVLGIEGTMEYIKDFAKKMWEHLPKK